MNKLFYIALPYTHKDKAVIAQRVDKFCAFDSKLNMENIQTVSPILKHLLLERNLDMPGDWNFWKDLSYTYLSRCDGMIVYEMDGWKESLGVTEEIKFAKQKNIPIMQFNESMDLDAFILFIKNMNQAHKFKM